ncbi:pectate lyase-like protein [Ruminiclostridium sufflavum DSM 19573]|uniref:Pectate lyase-like protein n=1 Tax=Ruminiclostridium sufflavum DSM 19573 TaxID=1121337 RepID=A0A318XSF5_9FIRM|nr:glycosyl hydrolase family 28-related protein [Ruminiclostridium sufflavum]PYG89504.1 pectate lyase-like protein [Ruminiclostridium sufflavum DSM 19573]
MPINIFSKASRTLDTVTNAKSYGATGSGTTDDSAAIQSAVDYVSSIGGGTVFIPSGIFLVRNCIRLRNKVNLSGLKGSSIIKIDDTFKGNGSPNSISVFPNVLWNEHSQNTFDSATADSFTIKDLTFIHSSSLSSLNSIILLRNTNGVTIDSCEFSMSGKASALAVYAYSCNYYMRICNNKIINMTGADTGGGIWVSNLTNIPDETNMTCDVSIEGNSFTSNSSAESLAIYGRDGIIKNTAVSGNKFLTLKNKSKPQSKVFSIYGRTYYTASTGTGVENIIVANNLFNVEEFGAAVIAVGSSVSLTDKIKNVLIDSNIINFKTEIPDTNATCILGYDTGTAENIKVSNNIISNTGNIPCKYGIYKMWNVERNHVKGAYAKACISDCINAVNNYLYDNMQPNSAAIKNSSYICGNVVQNCLRGILIDYEGTYNILNNIITLSDAASATGIYIVTAPSSSVINGNTIYTVNSVSSAFNFTIGKITMLNNMKFGTGKYIYSNIVLAYASGNRIDDSGFDTFYPGQILDNEIQDALPVGHVCMDTSTVSPAIGRRKILPGNGANKWQVIKM